MTIRKCLPLTCTALALLAGSAIGQSRDQNTTDPQRTASDRSSPTKDAANRDVEKDAMSRGRDQAQGAGSAAPLLRDMQGTYRVDIRINPSNWHMGPKGANNAHPANQRTDLKDGTAGMKSCAGYAVSDLIMGGNVLRQTFVSNEMTDEAIRNGSTTRAPADRDISALSIGQDAFRGLSYLAFDKETNTYQAVFMDNISGNMHTSSGSYDATGRRLELMPAGDKGGPSGRANAANPNERKMGHAGKKVVVEILGSDSYRVTMYKDGAGDATNPANNPGNNAGDNAGNNRTDRNVTADDANIVYTATYTRATGTDMSGINRLLSQDTQLWPNGSGRGGVDGLNNNDLNNRGQTPDRNRDPNRDSRTNPVSPSAPGSTNPR